MKKERPSFTAAWVAGCRGLTELLPLEARLAFDPFGLQFGGSAAQLLDRFARAVPSLARAALPFAGPLAHTMVWMQVRTRVLDDALREFIRDGGRQLVLLGAGFDTRASRLSGVLDDAVVYEIDHPATQARKREVIARAHAPSARVEYVAWDFEHDAMDELPARLATRGFDRSQRTMTIWEGVTMYLTEPAIEASVASVAAFSAPGSIFAVTYFDRARVSNPSTAARLVSVAVARVGEPFRFGWDPPAFPEWMAARGFEVIANDRDTTLAHRYGVPRSLSRSFDARGGYIALARRQAT